MAFLGTILSWFLLNRFGRRTLYLWGEACLAIILLIVGIVSVSTESGAGLWLQAGFTMFWLFVYSLTVGPIAYAIVAETSAMRLRAQTVCLARNTYQVVNIISGILVPYMMNPTEWNWKGESRYHSPINDDVGQPFLLTQYARQNGILLGWNRIFDGGLGVLPSPRGQGPHLRGIGYHVRQQGPREEIQQVPG